MATNPKHKHLNCDIYTKAVEHTQGHAYILRFLSRNMIEFYSERCLTYRPIGYIPEPKNQCLNVSLQNFEEQIGYVQLTVLLYSTTVLPDCTTQRHRTDIRREPRLSKDWAELLSLDVTDTWILKTEKHMLPKQRRNVSKRYAQRQMP